MRPSRRDRNERDRDPRRDREIDRIDRRASTPLEDDGPPLDSHRRVPSPARSVLHHLLS